MTMMRFDQSALDLFLPSHQLIGEDLALGRAQQFHGDDAAPDHDGDAVLGLQEVLYHGHLVRSGPLDVRTDDVQIGDYAHQDAIVIDDRHVPEAITEEDAGGVVQVHLGVHGDRALADDLLDRQIGGVVRADQLLGGYEPDEVPVLGDRHTVELAGYEHVHRLFHRVVEGHMEHFPDHVILHLELPFDHVIRRTNRCR